MESGYEFDSLSELPPLPQVYAPMEYYSYDNIESSLPPFPQSDFTPHGGLITFSDTLQDYLHLVTSDFTPHSEESTFTDSSLSLLTRDYLTESTQFENHLSHDVPFLHLPDLKTVEDTNSPPYLSLAPPPPPLPVARHNVNLNRRHVGSRVKNTISISPSSPSKFPASHGTRKVSERIRSLEKIMPWEKKMSLAAILEETHKYITFLHSQIDSLRWMPLGSVYPGEVEAREATNLLKCLTRQQLLQVIANSPGSRNVLYTQGVCVFSYEQLLTLEMMAGSGRNL